MIKKSNREKLLPVIEYLIFFICIFATYFFIIPRTDDFIFSKWNIHTFGDAFNFILNYGNGRALGNLILLFFCEHFMLAEVLIAVTLTAAVILTDRLFFGRNAVTPAVISLMFAFPCSAMLSECYYWQPAFINYVVPIVFILAVLNILKKYNDGKNAAKVLNCILIAAITFCACLFSENTSAVVIAISVLLCLEKIIRRSKINPGNIVFVLFSFIGMGVMLIIPKLTGVEHKLDKYRTFIAFTPSSIISNTVSVYLYFCEIFIKSTVVIALISAVLVLFVLKGQSSGFMKKLQTVVFIICPLFSVLINIYNSDNKPLRCIYAVFTALYLADILITVLKSKHLLRNYSLSLFALILFAPLPMCVTEKQGPRTEYITFFVMILFACNLLRCLLSSAEFREFAEEKSEIKANAVQIITACGMAVLICISGFITFQSVYNYNYYTVRVEYVQSIMYTDEPVEIVPLPYDGIYVDEGIAHGINSVFPNVPIPRVVVVNAQYFNQKNSIYKKLPLDPIQAVIYAFNHLEYKSTEMIR